MARTEQVRSAAISFTAGGAGDTQIVAAQGAGKKIRVLGYVLTAAAAGALPKWRSAANDISGAMQLPATGGVSAPALSPDLGAGWLETNANEALALNVAAAGAVGGHVLYQVV